MSWGFSQYNTVVKQVEAVSDHLHSCADRVEKAGADTDAVARGLLRKLRGVVAGLDKDALRMLALYDPAARSLVAARAKIDPRRGVERPKAETTDKKKPRLIEAPRVKRA